MDTLADLERVAFKPGDFLFVEGEQSYFFMMIEEGEVEILLKDPTDPRKEITVAQIGPGQPIGEFALVVNKPRSATARAKTAGSAIKISKEGYDHLL